MPSLFIMDILTDPFRVLSWILIVVFSICVHEYAHARTSLALGDDTAALLGHLSLNPLKQMGPISLVMLLAVGLAWGAVPVDVRRLRGRGAAATVAIAGPVANLAIGAVAALLCVLTTRLANAPMIEEFFSLAAILNATLFIFNMLPVPMLDGWQVVALAAPGLKYLNPMTAQNVSLIALVVLWTTPVGGFIWRWGDQVAAWLIGAWSRVPGLG
jgi:Zn-dependent protease